MTHSLWLQIAAHAALVALVVGTAVQGFHDGYRKRVDLGIALPVAVVCVLVEWCLLYAWTRDELLPAMLAGFQVVWAVSAVTGQYRAIRKARRKGGTSG